MISDELERAMSRFNAKWAVDLDGCHIWQEWTDEDGYGRFKVAGKTRRAHRWFFEAVHGWLPPAILHDCDKPPCVREQCLIPGTHSDNMRDMIMKGRGRNQFEKGGVKR